jgi:ATP-dependent Clp protease ATP-binding subunit ClpA
MSEVNKTTRVSLHLVPTVYKYLANKGYNKAVGARDLTRVFDQEINSDFSEVLQNNQMIFDLPNYEAKVVAELIKGKIAFIFSKKNVKEIVKESKRTYTNIF